MLGRISLTLAWVNLRRLLLEVALGRLLRVTLRRVPLWRSLVVLLLKVALCFPILLRSPPLALLHLDLVRRDHQEEVYAKHPGKNAAEGKQEFEFDHCHEDLPDLHGETKCRQPDPWGHQTHVALKQKVDVKFK